MSLLPLFLSLLAAASVQGQNPRFGLQEKCLNKNLDIFFVLDSSSSIWVRHYRRVVRFVSLVVGDLDIGPTRVGALSFGDKVNDPGVRLTWWSKGELLAAINLENLPYVPGDTQTNKAIEFVRRQNYRRDAAKVMVLVTDGDARGGDETLEKTRWQALEAREDGFTVFVVGVGQYQDKDEMNVLASDPDSQHVFDIGGSRDLDEERLSSVKDLLLTAVCNNGEETLPPIPPRAPTWRPRRTTPQPPPPTTTTTPDEYTGTTTIIPEPNTLV